MTDYFSKYIEVIALPNKQAPTMAGGIVQVYCRQGALVRMISDQGREFLSVISDQGSEFQGREQVQVQFQCSLDWLAGVASASGKHARQQEGSVKQLEKSTNGGRIYC